MKKKEAAYLTEPKAVLSLLKWDEKCWSKRAVFQKIWSKQVVAPRCVSPKSQFIYTLLKVHYHEGPSLYFYISNICFLNRYRIIE